MAVVHHQCKGFLKFLIPEDTITIDMEVMTLKGIYIFWQDRHSNEKTFIPWSDHNKPPSSFLKRLRDTQGTTSKEFLEMLVGRNLDENSDLRSLVNAPKLQKCQIGK